MPSHVPVLAPGGLQPHLGIGDDAHFAHIVSQVLVQVRVLPHAVADRCKCLRACRQRAASPRGQSTTAHPPQLERSELQMWVESSS